MTGMQQQSTVNPLPPPDGAVPWRAVVLLATALLALNLAINVREGLISPWAITFLTIALAAFSAACVIMALSRPPAGTGGRTMAIATAALATVAAVQFIVLLLFSPPGTVTNVRQMDTAPLSQRGMLFEPRRLAQLGREARQVARMALESGDPLDVALATRHVMTVKAVVNGTTFQRLLMAVGLLAVFAALPWRFFAWVIMPLLLAAHLLLGAWVIRTTPAPFIDVHVFQQQSCEALAHGRNPYGITFPNIYGPNTFVYGADDARADRLEYGYPYMPLSLLMALPGYLLGGDHRWSQLAAITLAAAMLAYAGREAVWRVAAIALLLAPRLFMTLELAWTEPFVILSLSLTLWCARRRPRLMPWALGLLLASKQYMVFAVPLTALLVSPFSWRQWAILLAKAAVVAVAVSAPLALWDVPAFIKSAVVWQFRQPFRNDALSYLAWLWWAGIKDLPPRLTWLAFVAVIPATLAALKWLPRGAGGFAVALTLVYLTFLAVNKQAFCNYYMFVVATLCWAIPLLVSGPAAPGNGASGKSADDIARGRHPPVAVEGSS